MEDSDDTDDELDNNPIQTDEDEGLRDESDDEVAAIDQGHEATPRSRASRTTTPTTSASQFSCDPAPPVTRPTTTGLGSLVAYSDSDDDADDEAEVDDVTEVDGGVDDEAEAEVDGGVEADDEVDDEAVAEVDDWVDDEAVAEVDDWVDDEAAVEVDGGAEAGDGVVVVVKSEEKTGDVVLVNEEGLDAVMDNSEAVIILSSSEEECVLADSEFTDSD